MEDRQYVYDAFISYRHCPLDKFVAENLHKELEAFQLPKGVRKHLAHNGRTAIKRVFRDRDELPLASNLADPITKALEDSEYLIVICTPRLPESMWCRKEIETFAALHGRERIFAVLAEGEPSESFPPELLYAEEEYVEENGRKVSEKKMIEPLAADVRGGSRREIRKKIRTELLRLAAAMCGCGYDDLKQRHRERRMKRILAASCTAAAVCLAFGAFSTAMALRIRSQKQQIEIQAQEIAEQYREVLRSNAVITARESERLLAEGDRVGAVRLARSVLSGESDGERLPWTPQAQYALTESLYLYENDNSIRPVRLLEQEGVIETVRVSPEGGYALILDAADNLVLWDLADGSRKTQIGLGNVYYYEDQFAFLSEDLFTYPTEEGMAICSTAQPDSPDIYPAEGCEGVYADAAGGYYLIAAREGMEICGTQNREAVMSYTWEEEMHFAGVAAFDAESGYVAAALENTAEEEHETQVLVFSIPEKRLLYTVKPSQRVEQMLFDKGRLYLTANTWWDMRGDNYWETGNGILSCLDAQTGDSLWEIREEDPIYDCCVGGSGEARKLIYNTYDTVVIVDSEDGRERGRTAMGSEIVAVIPAEGTDSAVLFTRDGKFVYLNPDNAQAFYYENKFRSTSDNVMAFYAAKGCYLVQSYNDNCVGQYGWTADPELKELLQAERSVMAAAADRSGSRIVAATYGDRMGVELHDSASGELVWAAGLEKEYGRLLGILEDSREAAVVSGSRLVFLSLEDGSVRRTIELENSPQIQGLDRTGAFLLASDYNGLYALSLQDGNRTELSGEEWQRMSRLIRGIGPSMQYTAMVSEEEKAVFLYDIKSGGAPRKLPVNTAYLSALCFNQDDSILYVSYKNNRTEAYRTSDLTLVSAYDDMGSISRVEQAGNASLLIGGAEAWLTDENGAVVARMDGYLTVMPDASSVLLQNYEKVYRVPIHGREQILKYADMLLEEEQAE